MKNTQFLAVIVVMASAFLVACNANTDEATTSDSSDAGSHVHDDGTVHNTADDEGGHTHGEGPHGGTVADWGGGKFHVEFTVDHDKQEATVYILGGDEKTASPIDAQEITLAINDPLFSAVLSASPQDGESNGKASRFVGTHENLGIVKEYEGTISGAVGGTPYSGKFKELAHDH